MMGNLNDLPRMTHAELKTNLVFYRGYDDELADQVQAHLDRRPVYVEPRVPQTDRPAPDRALAGHVLMLTRTPAEMVQQLAQEPETDEPPSTANCPACQQQVPVRRDGTFVSHVAPHIRNRPECSGAGRSWSAI